jgi:hypothetical protein
MCQHAPSHPPHRKLPHKLSCRRRNFRRRARLLRAGLRARHPAQQRTKQSCSRQNPRNHHPVFLVQHRTSPNYLCPSISKTNTPPQIRHPPPTFSNRSEPVGAVLALECGALPPPLRTNPFDPTNRLHRFPPSADTPIPTRLKRPNSLPLAIPEKPSETTQSSPQKPDPSPPDQTAPPHPW